MAFALPAVPAILEAISAAAVALGIVGTGVVVADQVSRANQRARDRARDQAAADTCVSCRRGPCAALAAGAPGARYRGGAHGLMKLPANDGMDSHHIPARTTSNLNPEIAPAIQMDPADHRRTASYGSSPRAVAYRNQQSALIRGGNYRAAFAMDVADLQRFAPKYNAAIVQATAYMECLKRNGMVQ